MRIGRYERTAQTVQLRHGIHACAVGDRTVILNLATDRYYLLPAAAHAALLVVGSGASLEKHQHGLQRLLDLGLVEPAASPAPETASAQPPSGEVHPAERPASIAAMAGALRAHAGAMAQERRAMLYDRIQRLRRLKSNLPADRDDASERLVRIVTAFRSIQILLPEHDRCLVRSMALFSACCREGVRVELVIGVKLDPFAAHCWVQRGAEVVNDRLETVRLYHPILAV